MTVEMVDAWEAGVRPDGMAVIHVAVLADGVPYLLSMPGDTLEWRAAEYDIDPDAFDELLRLVIAERFIDSDPAHPEFVYNTDAATARASQQARCRAAVQVTESALKRVNALGMVEPRAVGEPKPSEKIRALVQLSREVVAEKAQLVERVRERRRPPQEPTRITDTERATRVRAMMRGTSP
jgi:hypothetical protein